MEASMTLDQANYHVENTEPLQLNEVIFKIQPDIKEQKHLFKTSSYKLLITAEVNHKTFVFEDCNLNKELIAKLEKNPARFLVGSEPPFLCGTDWPGSLISDIVEANNVPLDSLIITDGEHVCATIANDEILSLINWFKVLLN